MEKHIGQGPCESTRQDATNIRHLWTRSAEVTLVPTKSKETNCPVKTARRGRANNPRKTCLSLILDLDKVSISGPVWSAVWETPHFTSHGYRTSWLQRISFFSPITRLPPPPPPPPPPPDMRPLPACIVRSKLVPRPLLAHPWCTELSDFVCEEMLGVILPPSKPLLKAHAAGCKPPP
eukprot:768564-Hanusia_phi.AAC.9